MSSAEGDTLAARMQAMPSYGAGEDPMAGLSSKDAARLLEEYGPNELEPQAQDSFFKILASQMCNLIFLLTGTASLICYLTGDEIKGTFLIVLVCVVCTCNAIGEWSSQDASAALKAMNPESAKVMRDGQLDKNFALENIVPGDIVHLTIGDTIPADMELIKCNDLQTNEAVLTGEPSEVNKSVVPKEGEDSAFPSNMLYKSTDVVAGAEIVARVTATGMRTQVGLIAKRLKPKDDSIAKKISPLQKSINVLGSIIGATCAVVICVGTAACIGLQYRSLPPACTAYDTGCLYYTSVVRGLLMAVAIIPHGLPLVVMVMLRVASKQMLDKNAVVTKQSAVDYLGAAHFICTDKTGTLTEGKMAAKQLVGFTRGASGATINPMSIQFYPMKGLDPAGRMYPALELTDRRCKELDKARPDWDKLQGLHDLTAESSDELPSAHLARACAAAACINCHATKVFKKGNAWAVEGNMSEGALKVASIKGGYDDDSRAGQHLKLEHVREAELEVPFTSKRKMSVTVHHLMNNQNLSSLQFEAGITHYAILKGAPDRVVPYIGAVLEVTKDGASLAKEPATAEDRAVIEKQNGELAKQALRSLVMAVRPLKVEEVAQLRAAESADDRLQLILGPQGKPGPLAVLGLWGIFDPPRTSVPPSIQQCHDAGIEVVMITGDQRDTALAIAKLVGITSPVRNHDRPTKALADGDIAKKCTELHHEKPHLIKEMSKQDLGGDSPGGATLKKQRSLRVHDEKTAADAHESEYKDDRELADLTANVRVWSRAQPSDKVCIVDSLCQQCYITAMTGDGVNDAPALKGADIGTAMGIAGTAVTRNSADLILQDDNFSTIVAAVAEGRKIYGNLQKYVVFNLSAKAGECVCVLTAIFFGLALPVQGLQQLVNMVVTHIIPPMALAWEDAEWYNMLVPPRDTKNDLVLNRTHMIFRWLPFILCFGVVIMTNVCYGVWMHTGFVTVHALVGSSLAGAVTRGDVACQLGGHLVGGAFIEDEAPYHCRCSVKSTPWQSMESAEIRDQWGRSDAPVIHLNRWTGDVGDVWNKGNTPFAGRSGEEDLLEPCRDDEGVRHMCWKNPDAERPLLDSRKNCAIYGGQSGETMGYVSVQVGEVLSLMTYRTDGPVWYARTSWIYNGVLAFNLGCLFIVLYVPAASELLELYPLSPLKLGLSLIAPIAMVFISEIIKIGYRHQLAVEHTLRGIHPPNEDEIGKP